MNVSIVNKNVPKWDRCNVITYGRCLAYKLGLQRVAFAVRNELWFGRRSISRTLRWSKQIENMKKLQVAILAAALAGAGNVRGSVTLTLDNVNPEENVYIGASGSYTLPTEYVQSGVYNLTVNGVATPSFCIDIATDQTEGTVYNNYSYTTLASAPISAAGPMNALGAANIEKLWAAYYSASLTSQTVASALQVEIWNVVAIGNGTYTVSWSGLNSDTSNEIITMQNALASGSLTTEADLMALVSPTGQAYLVAVPEATTVIAGALLLLPFGASVLRILRKNRVL